MASNTRETEKVPEKERPDWERIARRSLGLSLQDHADAWIGQKHKTIARSVRENGEVEDATLSALSKLEEFWTFYLQDLAEICGWSKEEERLLFESLQILSYAVGHVRQSETNYSDSAAHGADVCRDLADLFDELAEEDEE